MSMFASASYTDGWDVAGEFGNATTQFINGTIKYQNYQNGCVKSDSANPGAWVALGGTNFTNAQGVTDTAANNAGNNMAANGNVKIYDGCIAPLNAQYGTNYSSADLLKMEQNAYKKMVAANMAGGSPLDAFVGQAGKAFGQPFRYAQSNADPNLGWAQQNLIWYLMTADGTQIVPVMNEFCQEWGAGANVEWNHPGDNAKSYYSPIDGNVYKTVINNNGTKTNASAMLFADGLIMTNNDVAPIHIARGDGAPDLIQQPVITDSIIAGNEIKNLTYDPALGNSYANYKNGTFVVDSSNNATYYVGKTYAQAFNVTVATSVTINPTTATMHSGDTLIPVATVGPATATNHFVSWSSNTPSVATVDSKTGKITAIADGNAIITATATDGGGAKATLTVAVTTPANGMTILGGNVSDSVDLSATQYTLPAMAFTPATTTNQNVKWACSNTSIATVSNVAIAAGVSTGGQVTLLKAGTVTLTATSEDGSFKATFVLKITNNVTSVTASSNTGSTWTVIKSYGSSGPVTGSTAAAASVLTLVGLSAAAVIFTARKKKANK